MVVNTPPEQDANCGLLEGKFPYIATSVILVLEHFPDNIIILVSINRQ